MIDDSKITQAVDAYIGYPKELGEGVEVSMRRDAFREGAKWFKETLWHDTSEKPIMSEHGMIIVELNDITTCKYSLWRSTTTYECLCNNKGYVRRWLYLDDLLKEGGEK